MAKRDAPMLHIGAGDRRIDQVTAAIMKILATAAGDDVKIAAIEALAEFGPKSVAITGNTFTQGVK